MSKALRIKGNQDLVDKVMGKLKASAPKDKDCTFEISRSSRSILSKIRYVLTTGIDPRDLPGTLKVCAVIRKPFGLDNVESGLVRALSQSPTAIDGSADSEPWGGSLPGGPQRSPSADIPRAGRRA